LWHKRLAEIIDLAKNLDDPASSPPSLSDRRLPQKAFHLEGVELKFIDLQLGCAYMYVCSKRRRTLSGRSSLEKMEDMIHE
jgi:hypothetical protein